MNPKAMLYSLLALLLFTITAGVITKDDTGPIDQVLIYEEEPEIVEEESLPEEDLVDTPTLYPVVRVIDGDTIVIDKDGMDETVRFIGIDTPETVHPSKPVQCFGQEASRVTKEWLEGRSVSLEIDPVEGERDKYRRLLGYVYRDDGLFVNLEPIRQGYAYEYTYNLPYQYQAEFQNAELEARTEEAGLWSSAACQ